MAFWWAKAQGLGYLLPLLPYFKLLHIFHYGKKSWIIIITFVSPQRLKKKKIACNQSFYSYLKEAGALQKAVALKAHPQIIALLSCGFFLFREKRSHIIGPVNCIQDSPLSTNFRETVWKQSNSNLCWMCFLSDSQFPDSSNIKVLGAKTNPPEPETFTWNYTQNIKS